MSMQLKAAPNGKRMSETMVMIAVAGCWPRTRKVDLIRAFKGDAVCVRCKLMPETIMHRYWECEKDTCSPAYEASAELTPQALAQVNLAEAFWTRSLIPASWTVAPDPEDQDRWLTCNVPEVVAGCLGEGSNEAPTIISGDASGGPESKWPRLRRVRLAIVKLSSLTPCALSSS